MRFSHLILLCVHRDAAPDFIHRTFSVSRAALLAACLALASHTIPADAQVPPWQDVVPLAELETTTDDLIRLATSYADALREAKIAKLNVNTLQTLQPSAVILRLEFQIASINVQTADGKVVVLRAIVEKQLAAAEAKLEVIKRIESLGAQLGRDEAAATQARSQIAQAQATVNILRMIREMK